MNECSARTICLPLLFASLLILFSSRGQTQTFIPPTPWQVDSLIIIKSSDFHFNFPDSHRPQIETLIILKNSFRLRQQSDYQLVNEFTIDFFGNLLPGDSLVVRYKRKPFELARRYVLFERDSMQAAALADSARRDSLPVRLREIKFENPFATVNSDLQTSGSIMRGVKIGTNRDLTLNSGLNVELSGKLTDGVEIVAALTDEATPIQPEGNTQTLQEIDKVFVEFKTPYVNGTVGDFNLMYRNSQFGNVNRKLQGLTAVGNYKSNILGGTIASTRGFFNRVSFIGQEGNQGPYQLTGKNGERDIIVLAGTERVWINSNQMVRGEDNDYIIEYGNGQITFTNKRLITSESRIEIDFEYYPAIQKFNRNVYGGVGGASLFNDQLKLNIRYFREADDPDQVLEEGGELTAEEREIIGSAGDDPLKAFVPGESFRADTSGSYNKIDTTLNGQAYSYFRYVGRDNGFYIVRFSYVGQNSGDYIRDRLGVYRWTGVGKGDYMPVRLLPLPVEHEMADIQAEWNPSQRLKLQAEFAATRLDKNRLSSLDDIENQGNAFMFNAGLKEQPLKIAGSDLGLISLTFNTKHIDKNFESVDRILQPDFNRYWNVLQQTIPDNRENSFQFNTVYQPMSSLKFLANAGFLKKSMFESERYFSEVAYDDKKYLTGQARYEFISSKLPEQGTQNNWWRYSGDVGREVWRFKPSFNFQSELRKNWSKSVLSGFKIDEYGAKLGLIDWTYFRSDLQYTNRDDYIYDIEESGRLAFQARSTTKRFSISLQGVKETSASLEIIQRDKTYADEFKNVRVDSVKLQYVDPTVQDTVWQDRTTNLADLRIGHSAWQKALNLSVQYRISTKQTALKEKVYLDVGDGRGNLRYDEQLDEYVPDPDGKYVLFILSSGRFEPVTNLQTAIRLRLDPQNVWKRTSSPFKKFLTNLSAETYFRVEEETKETDLWSIYLLNLNKFQSDSTIRGTIQFNQDVYIMRRNRNLSFRLRYRLTKNRLNQFLDLNENEDRNTDEKELRLLWRLTNNIRSQTDLRQKLTFRDSKSNQLRSRDITGWYINQNFSYRPSGQWEFGLETEYGSESNKTPLYPLDLWYTANKGRITYSLPGTGRITGEYIYQDVRVTDNPFNLTVPYEMGQGRKAGINQTWQLRTEYTVAENILFTIFYSGRDEAGFDRIIHSGQAEIRAFF